MVKFYFTSFRKVFVLATFIVAGSLSASAFNSTTLPDTTRRASKSTVKITDTRKDRPSNTGVKINFVPFKPAELKPIAGSQGTPKTAAGQPEKDSKDNKVLTNLKVFPIPVDDQINFSYHIAKDANVTIKVMDLLGNEIATLLSQKMSAGEQLNTFNISSKLTTGIYFIRFVVGNEPVIKRISVL
ncbi:T9SS type A sorting domain-containing protein [Hufsiella ginkgonis]|uniref:T9SS type A sorting domain-containing protein n=1 Tax=Hufsiella ginkgonis TaxID=2695274 RepID=A0A7K1Y3H9_9SPHI|nr:T9SS type A sorting domain-containing protein [Hufsiella ginkgonis]MXV17801.1 T9SS type A sorting domain-containing protein [Hufsiella ginkgonis]